jgi:hypothetical protein
VRFGAWVMHRPTGDLGSILHRLLLVADHGTSFLPVVS